MSIFEKVTRWTPLVAIHPRHFCSTSHIIEQVDIEEWSEKDYAWEVDGWRGYKDYASKPETTIRRGHGDCEDYALVAASWELVHTDRPVYMGYMFNKYYPYPRHAICQAGDTIYSSGSITNESIEEYKERSPYDYYIRRRIR